MKQYWDLKSQELAQGALLFFRMGDFYELFGDDAVEASRLLEITLTSRDKNKQMPMAGVPHHSAPHYIQKLLKAGKKVAIAEQLDAPAKGMVSREIVRVLTPAIQFDAETPGLRLLACLKPVGDLRTLNLKDLCALGALDVSTGHSFFSGAQSLETWIDLWPQLSIAHVLIPAQVEFPAEVLAAMSATALVEPIAMGDLQSAALKRGFPQWSVASLQELVGNDTAIAALSIVVNVALKSQAGRPGHAAPTWSHFKLPRPVLSPTTLRLGTRTLDHLDVDAIENQLRDTKSAAGAREWRRWIQAPLVQVTEIQTRQTQVRSLARHPGTLETLRQGLAAVYDVERILGRVHARMAQPKDTWALAESIRTSRNWAAFLGPLDPAWGPLIQNLEDSLAVLLPLSDSIASQQRAEVPASSREGGIFQFGAFQELDPWITLCERSDQWLLEYESKEREATGIGSLKVKYNRVTGYSIEITKTNLKHVPPHYQRKQSMVGAERFVTPELATFDEQHTQAQFKRAALEERLFNELLEHIAEHAPAWMKWAETIALLDALQSFAQLLDRPGWILPTIDDASAHLRLRGSRHPVVDAALGSKFVPNDVELRAGEIQVITGPNMGGKSTLLRQVAVTVLLGQAGSPVPAREASWSVMDAVFTRIGAHDAIARGQSTFLVEMTELAQILQLATHRSLMVLDEIGRGTSTYDGMSVAWSVLEHLADHTRGLALFATHYHELTALSDQRPAITNHHMRVQENDGQSIEFQYQLAPGPASQSFGIHVARMAGLPESVIQRAWDVLRLWEPSPGGKRHMISVPRPTSPQLELRFVSSTSNPDGVASGLTARPRRHSGESASAKSDDASPCT